MPAAAKSKPKSVRKRSKHRMSVDYPRDVENVAPAATFKAKAAPRSPILERIASTVEKVLLAAEEGARDDAHARADARARGGDDARAAPGRDDHVGGRRRADGAGRAVARGRRRRRAGARPRRSAAPASSGRRRGPAAAARTKRAPMLHDSPLR